MIPRGTTLAPEAEVPGGLSFLRIDDLFDGLDRVGPSPEVIADLEDEGE